MSKAAKPGYWSCEACGLYWPSHVERCQWCFPEPAETVLKDMPKKVAAKKVSASGSS